MNKTHHLRLFPVTIHCKNAFVLFSGNKFFVALKKQNECGKKIKLNSNGNKIIFLIPLADNLSFFKQKVIKF